MNKIEILEKDGKIFSHISVIFNEEWEQSDLRFWFNFECYIIEES